MKFAFLNSRYPRHHVTKATALCFFILLANYFDQIQRTMQLKESGLLQNDSICLQCRYMKQRCDFLDNLPFFNFNQGEGYEGSRTNTKCLGSTLMQTMLHEVISFCDPNSKENWTEKTHQQVNA